MIFYILAKIISMEKIFYYNTEIGKIGITEDNRQITHLYFESNTIPENKYVIEETEIIKEAYRQLQEYFAGKRKTFALNLSPFGTEFMQNVWNALLEIPYGDTRSYKDIAQKINNEFAYRAVGLANSRNPIPIFIPCHRVIGSDKKLVGFGGGLEIKQYLLSLENKYNKISA